jgi:hypothetical protein
MNVKFYVILLLFGFIKNNIQAQSYFPKLNNLFLMNEGAESIFTPETEFFRLELRENFNKLFYGDLQTSNGGSRRNSSAFYSMKIIPRFVFETNLFDASMKLKFNVPNDGSKFPSFPIICNEYSAISDDDKKEGKGTISTDKGALSVQFSSKLIASIVQEIPSAFLIEQINYMYKNDVFEIDLQGEFANDVKIKKVKYLKDAIQNLKLVVKNNSVTVYVVSKNKAIEVYTKSIKNEISKK